MGRMKELDTILADASRDGEAAGRRLKEAIDALESWIEATDERAGAGQLFAELKGAADDAYDAAVDLPLELGRFFNVADDPRLAAAALKVEADAEPELVKMVREIHAFVTQPRRILMGFDGSKTDDVDLTRIMVLPSDDGGPEFADLGAGPSPEEVPTRYGVRITYGDGTSEDLDNIDSVLVRDKETNTFPFGFQEVDGEVEELGDGDFKRGLPEYRAGFFRVEDGEFVPFSGIDQPKPFNGWGG